MADMEQGNPGAVYPVRQLTGCGTLGGAGNLALLKNEPTDAELAEQYRRELRDVLEPARALMDRALAHGLVLQFNLGRTPPNPRHEITNVQVVKYL